MDQTKTNNLLKKLLIKIIIIAFIFSLFFYMDFITKHFLFNEQIPKKSYGWIGIRSMRNESTMFFNFLERIFSFKISQTWIISIISTIAGLLLLSMLLIVKKNTLLISLSIILAGILANGWDFIAFGYVRDFIFTPWWDKGTFNLADAFIILGIFWTTLHLIFSLFSSNKENQPIKIEKSETK